MSDRYKCLTPPIPDMLYISYWAKWYSDVGYLHWCQQTKVDTKFGNALNYFRYFRGWDSLIYLPDECFKYVDDQPKVIMTQEYKNKIMNIVGGANNHFKYIEKLLKNLSRDEILNIPHLLPFLERGETDIINRYAVELEKVKEEKQWLINEKIKKEIEFDKKNKLQEIKSLRRERQQKIANLGCAINCVYFIISGNKIKIGKAKDFNKRLCQHKISNPDIRVIGIKLNEYEKDIHDMFDHCRIQNEWFKDCDSVRQYLCNNMNDIEKNLVDVYNIKLEQNITLKSATLEYNCIIGKRKNEPTDIDILSNLIRNKIEDYNKQYGYGVDAYSIDRNQFGYC